MLIVFEIAPEMKGCEAAIMVIWLSTDKKRLPIRPQTFAQSKIGRCSSLKCGAPSRVIAPQTWMFAASISSLLKPSASSMLKLKSLSCSSVKPSLSLQKSSPSVKWLKANLISNAFSNATANLANSLSPKPLSRSALNDTAWHCSRLP